MHSVRYERRAHGRGRLFIDGREMSARLFAYSVQIDEVDTVTVTLLVEKVEIIDAPNDDTSPPGLHA